MPAESLPREAKPLALDPQLLMSVPRFAVARVFAVVVPSRQCLEISGAASHSSLAKQLLKSCIGMKKNQRRMILTMTNAVQEQQLVSGATRGVR